MRFYLSVLSTLLFPGIAAQRSCGSAEPTRKEMKESIEIVRRYQRSGGGRRGNRKVTINTYWHAFTGNGSQGNNIADVNASMDVINAAFAPNFEFKLIESNFIPNKHYPSSNGSAMKNEFHKGTCADLNIYSSNLSGGLLGYATFPTGCASNLKQDGVVILDTSTPGNSGAYGEGDTLTHEIGHWLWLYHTFQSGCSGGDQVADTPPVARPNFGCPQGKDSCSGGGKDMIENYMDYTDDSCMDRFTPGQVERMNTAWDLYRKPENTQPPSPTSPTSPVSPPTKSPTTKKPTSTKAPVDDTLLPTAPSSSFEPTPFSTQIPTPTFSGPGSSFEPTYYNTQLPTPSLSVLNPTGFPETEPTPVPTDDPTSSPTSSPTDAPTDAPTSSPTDAPTSSPTDAPTSSPTDAPTSSPTDAPTAPPTEPQKVCKNGENLSDCLGLACHWKGGKCRDCQKTNKKKKCLAGGCNWDPVRKRNSPKCFSCDEAETGDKCSSLGCAWDDDKCLHCRYPEFDTKNICNSAGCGWKRNKCQSCREQTKKKKCGKVGCAWNDADGVCEGKAPNLEIS